MIQYLKVSISLVRKKKLTSKELHVYLALLTFNPCYPSHAALMRVTRMSRNTLVKTLNGLKKKKIVSWDTGRKGLNNFYHLKG